MHSVSKRQEGIVSVIVILIIITVLSLVVLAFAQLSRREQREALDKQLSTQAFYAAESGVNDAIAKINANVVDLNQDYTSNCDNFINAYGLIKTVNSTGPVEYTCLLVNSRPTNLKYDAVTTDKSTLIPLQTNNPINKINLSWQSNDDTQAFSSCPASAASLPPANQWPTPDCSAGILRIDLVPIGASLSRTGLMSGTFTAFLYPQNSGSTSPTDQTYDTTNNGMIVPANCNTSARPYSCNVSITGLTLQNYYLRVRSIYKTNALNVTAEGAGGNLSFSGAQILIDATGKANDVLRRIAVRLDIANPGGPDFAIQTATSICKQLAVRSGSVLDSCDPGSSTTGGGTLDAKYDVGCLPGAAGCGSPTGPTGAAAVVRTTRNWQRTFTNTSPGGSAPTCVWNWGDGTTSVNKACDYYTKISHTWPVPPDYLTASVFVCKEYTVVLTMNYTTGPINYVSKVVLPKYQTDLSKCTV